MMQSQRISSPKDCQEDYHKGHLPSLSWSTWKDYFTQELWGGLPKRTSSTLLIAYLKHSFDTAQIEDDFPAPNQSRDIEVHTLFLTLNSMKVATIYLFNGILGRNLCNLHSPGRKTQVSSLPKTGE